MEKLIDYNTLSYQAKTLAMEVEGMSDDALMDECNHIMITSIYSESMDKIMAGYFKKGALTSEEREKAVAFYSLAYGEFVWEC